MKRFLFLVLFIAALAGCKENTSTIKKSSDGSITLIMAEVGSEDTISSRMDKFFKDRVEELSEGKIKIEINYNGILGGEETVINVMQSLNSPIHLARVSTFSLSTYGSKKAILATIPFTFKDREHFWHFADSDVAQELLLEPYNENMGIKGLFFCEEGFRSFFSAYPLKSIEDFKNKKIRVSTDPIMISLVRAIGAEPVFVSTNDIYAAVQTGLVDCAEQPLVPYLSSSLSSVAPYIFHDEHTLGMTEVIITDDAWNYLNKNQQAILMQAGKMAADFCRKAASEIEAESIEKLKALNVSIIEPEDIDKWQKANEAVVKEYTAAYPELYQKILKAAE